MAVDYLRPTLQLLVEVELLSGSPGAETKELSQLTFNSLILGRHRC